MENNKIKVATTMSLLAFVLITAALPITAVVASATIHEYDSEGYEAPTPEEQKESELVAIEKFHKEFGEDDGVIHERISAVKPVNGSNDDIDYPEYSETYKRHSEQVPILGKVPTIFKGPIRVQVEMELDDLFLGAEKTYGAYKVSAIMKNETRSKIIEVDQLINKKYDKWGDSVYAVLHFNNNIRAEQDDTFAVCATSLETGQNDCQNSNIDNPRKLQKVTLFD